MNTIDAFGTDYAQCLKNALVLSSTSDDDLREIADFLESGEKTKAMQCLINLVFKNAALYAGQQAEESWEELQTNPSAKLILPS